MRTLKAETLEHCAILSPLRQYYLPPPNEPAEGDMAGVLDSSPPTPYFRDRVSPIPDDHVTVIDSHFGVLTVRTSGRVQTAKGTDEEDSMSSPITSSASSPLARARITSECYSPYSPPSCHTGGGDGDRRPGIRIL